MDYEFVKTELDQIVSDLRTKVDAFSATATDLTSQVARLQFDKGTLQAIINEKASRRPCPVYNVLGWTQVLAEGFDAPSGAALLPAVQVADLIIPNMTRLYGITNYPYPYPDTATQKGRKPPAYYSPANMSIIDGVLRQHLYSTPGETHVAALIPRLSNVGKYGDSGSARIHIRFRVPKPLSGFKIAWMFWPSSNHSNPDGEIDFIECNLSKDTAKMFVHLQGTDGMQTSYNHGITLDDGLWHETIVEWVQGNYIKLTTDGALIATHTNRVPANTMHCVIQSETVLNKNADGTYVAVDPTVDGTIDIEYIAAWVKL